MNFSGISNSKIGFSGIYGTLTKIKDDGTEEEINIILPEDDAKLQIDKTSCGRNVKLELPEIDANNQSIPHPEFEEDASYKNVQIYEVNGNSALVIKTGLIYNIETLKDNAMLTLGQPFVKGLKAPAARINRIEGENVKIRLHKNTVAVISNPSTVNLLSSRLRYYDDTNDGYVKVKVDANFIARG